MRQAHDAWQLACTICFCHSVIFALLSFPLRCSKQWLYPMILIKFEKKNPMSKIETEVEQETSKSQEKAEQMPSKSRAEAEQRPSKGRAKDKWKPNGSRAGDDQKPSGIQVEIGNNIKEISNSSPQTFSCFLYSIISTFVQKPFHYQCISNWLHV